MDERLIDSAPVSSDTARARSEPTNRLAVLVLALILLPTYLWTSAAFDELGIYDQYNILYDADPNARLPCFSEGWGDGRSLIHPNLCNLINPVIRILAAPFEITGLVAGESLRRQFAMAVAPLFAVASIGVLFLILRRVGCRLSIAFPIALLYGFSFSQWVFGAIPDHFALGGFSLAIAFWLLVDSVQRRRLGIGRWAAAGAFAASITLSNLALLGWIFLAAAAPLVGYRRAIRQGAVVVGLSLAMVFAIKLPMDALYGGARNAPVAAALFTASYVRDQPATNLAQYPGIVVGSFAVPESIAQPQREGLPVERYDFQLSLRGQAYRYATPLSLAAATTMGILLLAAGIAAVHRYRTGAILDRSLCVATGGLLAGNGLLHAVWGSEYILYSQHWLAAATLALAFLARTELAQSRALPIAFTLAAALIATANLETLLSLQTSLAGSGSG